MNDVTRLLMQTLDRINCVGWKGGAANDPGGPKCIMDTMVVFANDARLIDAAAEVVAREISGFHTGHSAPAIVIGWNDTPERTQAEVVFVLERSIKASEKLEESPVRFMATPTALKYTDLVKDWSF